MNRPVRVLHAFYEAQGPYAVDPGVTEARLKAATRIVGNYTGPIALAGVRGLRIPGQEPALPVYRLELPEGPHSIVVTKREIIGKRGRALHGACLVDRPDGGTLIALQDDPELAIRDLTGEKRLGMAVHEFGHSFGIKEHCEETGCIMGSADKVGVRGAAAAITSRKPFCDTCVADLELGGYQSLAQKLGASVQF